MKNVPLFLLMLINFFCYFTIINANPSKLANLFTSFTFQSSKKLIASKNKQIALSRVRKQMKKLFEVQRNEDSKKENILIETDKTAGFLLKALERHKNERVSSTIALYLGVVLISANTYLYDYGQTNDWLTPVDNGVAILESVKKAHPLSWQGKLVPFFTEPCQKLRNVKNSQSPRVAIDRLKRKIEILSEVRNMKTKGEFQTFKSTFGERLDWLEQGWQALINYELVEGNFVNAEQEFIKFKQAKLVSDNVLLRLKKRINKMKRYNK